jgi:hypothetical protein
MRPSSLMEHDGPKCFERMGRGRAASAMYSHEAGDGGRDGVEDQACRGDVNGFGLLGAQVEARLVELADRLLEELVGLFSWRWIAA